MELVQFLYAWQERLSTPDVMFWTLILLLMVGWAITGFALLLRTFERRNSRRLW